MSWIPFWRAILRGPTRWFTRFETILDSEVKTTDHADQVVYVMRSQSATDQLVAQRALRAEGLPDLHEPLWLNGTAYPRLLYLAPAKTKAAEQAVDTFQQLLEAHAKDPSLAVRVVPLGLFWGRKSGQEGRAGKTMVSDLDDPGMWRKFWLVLFSGRNILVRGSRPLQVRPMAEQFGTDRRIAHKLARVARVHFVRLRHAVAGPQMMERKQVISELLASQALQQAIRDEAKAKKISHAQAQKQAAKYLDEIAANYSETLVRVLDRFMAWLWSKIYSGVHVEGGDRIRALAQAGHEVIYVPCHRSHMDYLLLSYVIYKEGLVPPHIAAGVNLDFFPAGPLFRRGGAFFIRRSFKGNKLYSTVFREYLNRLFQKGYPVEYFTEGGRSRTGRLLAPKTGMVAMTVQGMLRGQTRPISLVPVYLGYEHIMEVGTYLKELKGKSKEKESVFQVLSSLRHLRDFGHGFVTFGKPINLGDMLDQIQPDWRSEITHGAEEPSRPRWLTPTVNLLAEQIMFRINNAAALNSVNLTALALLSAEHHSLSKQALIEQLDVYLQLAREVPYSLDIYVPKQSGEELWQLASIHDKFKVQADPLGDVIHLDGQSAIAMTYYRNNIMHVMIVPAIIAAYACAHRKFTVAEVTALLESLHPLLQQELFVSHEAEDLSLWVAALLEEFTRLGFVTQSDAGSQEYRTVATSSAAHGRLELLARASSETLQRYAILLELLQQRSPLGRAQLERAAVEVAERLSYLHGVSAPEFFDKKLISSLIATLKREQFIDVNGDGDFIPDQRVAGFSDALDALLEPVVMQSIRESVQNYKV